MTERERALDRCRKIRALADRATSDGERDAALSRLAVLTEKHGIGEHEVGGGSLSPEALRERIEATKRQASRLFSMDVGYTPGERTVFVKGPEKPGMTHVYFGTDDYRRIIWI